MGELLSHRVEACTFLPSGLNTVQSVLRKRDRSFQRYFDSGTIMKGGPSLFAVLTYSDSGNCRARSRLESRSTKKARLS